MRTCKARKLALVVGLGLAFTPVLAFAQADELFELSLDELMNVEVSSASWRTTSLKEASASATVFQRADIERLGLRHLHEVLAFVPGVYTSRTAGSRSDERGVMRGNSGTAGGVLVMVDGRRANAMLAARAFLFMRDFPLALVERIEVIRGPGSARFGGGPSDLVVNVTTRRDASFAGARVGERGTVGAYAGMSQSLGEWRVDARFSDGRESSPEYTGLFDRLQRRTTTEESTHERTALVDFGWRQHQLQLTHHRSDAQGYYGTSGTLDPLGTDIASLGSARYFGTVDAGPWALGWSVGAAQQRLSITTIRAPRGTGPYVQDDLRQRSDLDDRTAHASVTAQRQVSDHGLTFGLETRRGRTPGADLLTNYLTAPPFTYYGEFQPTGQRFLAAGASDRFWAVFAEDDWRVSETHRLVLGLRHDQYRQAGSATSPRVGWVWTLSEHQSLKLLYQDAFVAPSIGQLFLLSSSSIVGNAALVPARVRSFELVGSTNSDAWAFSGTLYHRRARDGFALVPVTNIASRTVNAARQQTTGVETSLQWRPSSTWHVTANGSAVLRDDYTLPTALAEAAPGDFLSRRTASLLTHWNKGPWGATFGSHWRSREPLQKQNNPWRSLLTLQYRPDAEWRYWVHASNLFDASASDADLASGIGTDANGQIMRALPIAGREMWVGVEHTWP